MTMGASLRKIFLAGSTGLVGQAINRRLGDLFLGEVLAPNRAELNLLDADRVKAYFLENKPDSVILAAARVGGIGANQKYPTEFLTENLQIQNNVMLSAVESGVRKLMFLGSSCIYPKNCRQPMREIDYMTGPLEETNASYAVAKIAGIRLAEAIRDQFGIQIVLPMPANVYGVGDHFDLENSHVLSALVMRMENARRAGEDSVCLWGTGTARREFLHNQDLADACLFLLEHDAPLGIVNVGSGTDISISELASLVKEAVGFRGSIRWDSSKPDGMPRKLLDVSQLGKIGWKSKKPLVEGIREVVSDYRTRLPEERNTHQI